MREIVRRLYLWLRHKDLSPDEIFSSALSLPVVSFGLRRIGLRALGYDIAPGAKIASRVVILGRHLKVSEGCYINVRALLDCEGLVTLEPHSGLAFDAKLLSTTHEIGLSDMRFGENIPLPITIGSGSWIGAGAIVLAGVTVGSGCIVGAGAIVNKDCEPNGVYAGVPARRIRDLPA